MLDKHIEQPAQSNKHSHVQRHLSAYRPRAPCHALRATMFKKHFRKESNGQRSLCSSFMFPAQDRFSCMFQCACMFKSLIFCIEGGGHSKRKRAYKAAFKNDYFSEISWTVEPLKSRAKNTRKLYRFFFSFLYYDKICHLKERKKKRNEESTCSSRFYTSGAIRNKVHCINPFKNYYFET